MQNKYFVYIPNGERKSVKKIPQPWQKRIVDVLTVLETNPYLGEKMEGEYSDKRKIRIWPYRIVYGIFEEKSYIVVYEIRHRGNTSYD